MIWFAIDTDTADYAACEAYLAGAAATCAPYTAALYAGAHVVDKLPGNLHWQTYAWSGGELSKKAALYQHKNNVTVGGASMDEDVTVGSALVVADGWLSGPVKAPSGPVEPPAPVPVPVHPPVAGGSHSGVWTNFPGSAAFKIGEANDAVWILGLRLQAAGFDKHKSLGHKTYAPSHVFEVHDLRNVHDFQTAQGWTGANADGYPGPLTWQKLGEQSNWKVS